MSWDTPTSDVLADFCFTLQDDINLRTTSYGDYHLPGLGMNIVRYNAGASGQGMPSTTMKKTRTIEGFWVDVNKRDPAEWDWERDERQVDMLRKAKDRGANVFEIFSNSPMWWMCHTRNPSGSLSGIKDNLPLRRYDDFARYLVGIVAHAKRAWDIEFEYIAPFNEPSSIWWNMSNPQGQEGCHFQHHAQAAVVKNIKDVIKEQGEAAAAAEKAAAERATAHRAAAEAPGAEVMAAFSHKAAADKVLAESVAAAKTANTLHTLLGNLKIAASDENTYDQAIDTWDSLDDGAKATVSKINVHGYQKGSGLRNELHKRASENNTIVWNSEYGDADETGLSLAKNLILDFNHLHPTAWVYWQPLDSGGWGLVQANAEDNWVGKPNAKLFVLAHFSRHIRQGMRILDIKVSDERKPNSVAAYSDVEKKLVLVTVNREHLRSVKYDLSRFQAAGNNVEVRCWSTDIDVAHVTCGRATRKPTAYKEKPKFELGSDLELEAWFDCNTIQTFEITGLSVKIARRS